MQYYVIGSDGNRYGPADTATLRLWINENRISPETLLESVDTGHRSPASEVEGLFPLQQPSPGSAPAPGAMSPPTQVQPQPFAGTFSEPPQYPAQYPRQGGYYPGYDNGNNELTWAFVLLGLGVVMCGCAPLFCAFGLAQANKAVAKGHPTGPIARTLNIVFLILGSCLWLFYAIMLLVAFTVPGFTPGGGP